jgi:hypothetical protein
MDEATGSKRLRQDRMTFIPSRATAAASPDRHRESGRLAPGLPLSRSCAGHNQSVPVRVSADAPHAARAAARRLRICAPAPPRPRHRRAFSVSSQRSSGLSSLFNRIIFSGSGAALPATCWTFGPLLWGCKSNTGGRASMASQIPNIKTVWLKCAPSRVNGIPIRQDCL